MIFPTFSGGVWIRSLEANQFSNCFQIDAIVLPWRLDLAVVGTTAILRLLHQAGSDVISELVWGHLGQHNMRTKLLEMGVE